MHIELIFNRDEDEELFDMLQSSALSDSSAFALDLGDAEYIALPYECFKSPTGMRVKMRVIECE